MFDPTAATTTGAGASRPSSRRAWLPLLQPLMLLACFLLTLVVFSCPDPLSASSGITLLTVRPYNMTETTVSNGAANSNSTSSSAGSTIVFGGANATTPTAMTSPVNATGVATATNYVSTSTTATSSTPTADPATTSSNRTLAASSAVAANESAAPAPASTASTTTEPSKRSSLPLLPRTNFQPLNISSSSSRSPPAQLERVTDDPLDTHGSLNNGTSTTTTTNSSNPSVSIITTSPPTGESLSLLELKYGPLGSCFRTWSGSRACTPASLKPSYDASHLTLKALGGFDTSGLPTTLKTTPALLVACISLLAALALSSGLAAGARLFPGTKMAAPLLQAGPAQRAWGTMQRAALWLRLGVALLLLGTAVSMRLVVSKAAYAFNASNAAKSIGAAYLTPEAATAAAGQHAAGGATQIGLQAVAGKGFGLLWATVLMLFIDFFLERRRLRREEAIAVARADLEAAWGREAMTMSNLGKSAAAATELKRSKKVKVVKQQEESDDGEVGDEEEQVKPADASRRRSFFWPTSPRLSRPRKVARKAVPSYKGGLAPVLGPLFNPTPAPAPIQAQGPYAGNAGAGGQGAVYIVQDKGSGGRQAAPQPQRVVTRNDYHCHHHHQQAAPSRKGSMSSASMSSCSGAAAAPRVYYQYGPAPRPQQQQQQQQQVPVAALPFESTAGGLASPPWASSTQMQHQQQAQTYGHSLAAAATTTTQNAALPAYRSRDPLIATHAPAAAPFGQYATYDDEDDDADDEEGEEVQQQQLAQPWRLKPGQHLVVRRASIDSPRSLAFNTTRGGRGVVAASDDGHLQARLPAQSQHQHQRSHSLNHGGPATFASWKTKEAFELQAAPVHRAGARPPAPAPPAGSSGTGSRSNSPYPPRVMRARRMSTSGESVGSAAGSMRSASGMGIGLRYVRS